MEQIDLKGQSGLPMKIAGNKLVFGKGMAKVEADIRTHSQMLPVLKNPEAKAPGEFYYMYRNVHLVKDGKNIKESGLRYDITVLPAFKVGDEFNKTFGHFHPKVLGTETWYPEVYEVLHGRAHYILQKGNEALMYDAKPGDKCLMPPGYGHITVNPSGKETLAMANWVFPGFNSEYGQIERMKGGLFYETVNGFVRNPNYPDGAKMRGISPKAFPRLGLTEKPLYTEGVRNPKKFQWLVRPQDYSDLFESYLK